MDDAAYILDAQRRLGYQRLAPAGATCRHIRSEEGQKKHKTDMCGLPLDRGGLHCFACLIGAGPKTQTHDGVQAGVENTFTGWGVKLYRAKTRMGLDQSNPNKPATADTSIQWPDSHKWDEVEYGLHQDVLNSNSGKQKIPPRFLERQEATGAWGGPVKTRPTKAETVHLE